MAGVLLAPPLPAAAQPLSYVAPMQFFPSQQMPMQHIPLRQWAPPHPVCPVKPSPSQMKWVYAAPRLRASVLQSIQAPVPALASKGQGLGAPQVPMAKTLDTQKVGQAAQTPGGQGPILQHGASMTKAQDSSQKVLSVKIGVPQQKPTVLVDGEVQRAEGVEAMNPRDFKEFWEQPKNLHTMVVVDLRSYDRASGVIAGAVPIPAAEMLSNLHTYVKEFENKSLVVFFCQYSAHRAPSVANFYRSVCPASQRVMVMSGGFRGWEAERLPIQKGPTAVQNACDHMALQIGKAFAKNAAAQ